MTTLQENGWTITLDVRETRGSWDVLAHEYECAIFASSECFTHGVEDGAYGMPASWVGNSPSEAVFHAIRGFESEMQKMPTASRRIYCDLMLRMMRFSCTSAALAKA